MDGERKGGMGAGPSWNRRSWQRIVPDLEKRSWYTVDETAHILRQRGIIHKTGVENKHGKGTITGEQQVRKYIRKGELEAELYEGSKKYGYIIDKDEVERFCEVKREELKKRYEKYLKMLNQDN